MVRWWSRFRAGEAVRCGACQGLRERQKAEAVKRLYEAILEAVAGSFEIPQSTRGQAAEAARFAISRLWCLGGLMMESRALRADIRGAIRDEKFPLAVEKWRP